MALSVVIFKFGPPEISFFDDSWSEELAYQPKTNVSYDILLDQHSHTTYSDGKLSVKQNIEWHKALGFNAVIITDHNTLKNAEEINQLAEEYQNEIIVIQGMEWTTRRIHLNFIGISQWELRIPLIPSNEQIQEAINYAHSQNALVTVNHYSYSENTFKNNPPSREQLLAWGVDFIEVINRRDFDYNSMDFVRNNSDSIGMITGTDIHSPLAKDGGKVYAWTALNVTEFSKKAVMDSLRVYNTTVIISSKGIENLGYHVENALYPVLLPFYELGEGLVFMYVSYDKSYSPFVRIVVIVFLTYSFGIFLLVEILTTLYNAISLKGMNFDSKKQKRNRVRTEKNQES